MRDPSLTPIGLVEALGLEPYAKAWREARLALGGDSDTPKSRFGLSTVKQLKPRWSVPLWLGRKPAGRRVPITNLYNYRQPPPELGWSVRVTDVLDFRGKANTYDSHNGTDFAIPPGTDVVAAAPGQVLRVSSEYHRGGRKVFLDHGEGLVTTYNHLARPLVAVGQRVKRGERIALSGYSGLDALSGFPWTPPHVHFNVWLDGVYVDPFVPIESGDASLWRTRNDPEPARGPDLEDARFEPTRWDDGRIRAAIDACKHAETRREIAEATSTIERAGAALFHLCYFPTRFDRGALGPEFSLYFARHARSPRLDLPFSGRDYDGVLFPDD
ncbi:MAG: M23 family metallopeptidase [Polyangiaceae bacterium]